MKKIFAMFLVLSIAIASAFALSSCDIAQEIDDITNTMNDIGAYDYAVVSFPDGFTTRIDLQAYLLDTTNAGLIYVYGRDGKGYIASQENCMLISDPTVDFNAKSAVFDSFKIDYERIMIKSPDGEIITLEKPGEETITSFMDLYTDENGVRYYADNRNIIIEFSYD